MAKINYHKITIRSMKTGMYLLENGFWTSNDSKARSFDSVKKGLDFIRTELQSKPKYHVTAFYRLDGYLMWHYHYL